MWVCRAHCVYCVSGEWSHCPHSQIKRSAGRLKDKIIALSTLWLISLWKCIHVPAEARLSVFTLTFVNVCRGADSRLGLAGFLLHDVQDHSTGGGAALWSRVDGDGLFCCAGIFLPMNVHPEMTTLRGTERDARAESQTYVLISV